LKQSSQTPANLSDSIQHRLNSYALMATAAGVGILALAPAVEAKIVYTPADRSITPNHTILLDLNHDGTTDFRLKDMHFTSTVGFDHTGILSVLPARQGNKIQGFFQFARHYASALNAGVTIGPKGGFTPGPKIMATVFSDTGARRGLSNSCDGPWSKAAKGRYLGLEFLIKGKVHFGWARLNVTCRGTDVLATLTGYAYETIPNKSIIAGKTKGPADEPGEEDFGPNVSLTHPIPDTPQPATLGVLALGTQGVPLWRRKESALEGD